MEVFKNFGIQPTLLFGQIVNFVIILFLLRKFFYGKIVDMLELRRNKIEESLKNAQLIEENLQKTKEDSAKILEDAQKNAQILIENAKKEAENISAKASDEARKTIEEALINAKAQIAAQHLQMQKQLEKETLSLVVDIVKKVLGKNLKDKEKLEITKAAIGEIGRQIQ